MSEHVAHTETDESTGVTLKIIADSDSGHTDPAANDEAVIMAVLHSKYINPARHAENRFPGADFDSPEGLQAFADEHADEWEAFPLFMYDHSGTIYQASRGGGNPFPCQWDSGRAGFIFVKRWEVTPKGADPEESAWKAAESFCEVYTHWANGDVWGYVVEDADGDTVESCWGFIGDSDDSYMMEEARGAFRNAIEKARVTQDTEATDVETVRAMLQWAEDSNRGMIVGQRVINGADAVAAFNRLHPESGE